MNSHHTQSAWPRNDSPAAKALVLIDWALRHQVAIGVAVLVVTAAVKGVMA